MELNVMFINYERNGVHERKVVPSNNACEVFNKLALSGIYDFVSLNKAYVSFSGFCEQGECIEYKSR